MCARASTRIMGCGRSRHNSPEDSQNDLKNSGSFRKHSSKKNFNKNAKKKRTGREGKTSSDSDASGKSSLVKKLSNGKNKQKEKQEDIDISLSFLSDSRTGATSSPAEGEKTNGATKPQGNYYLLEVPNEVHKENLSSTSRDVRTLAGAKKVHVTTSQLEFFKMLDEKIEMGGDYQPSNEASEVSSVDETCKQ